jgi:glycosyltransferase involved in cell wall biosynthesis
MERKVSVIIPNYNHSRFLEKRLSSVFNQSDFIDKIIILDDASTDESLNIIKKYKAQNVEIITNKANSGSVFKQWEKGLSLIEIDSLVWIAESDDVAHDDFLKESLPYFEDPDVVMTYTRSNDINEIDEFLGVSFKNLMWANSSFVKKGSAEVRDHLFIQCTIPNVSAVVFRRNVIDQSFFKHNFKLCGDWYFYIRLLENGKIAYNSKTLNFHRFHKDTMRSKSIKNQEILCERLLIVKEVRDRFNLRFYKYVSSMAFQIDLSISETKISELLGNAGKKMVKLTWKYGFFAATLTFFLIGKRIVKRLFYFGRKQTIFIIILSFLSGE